MLGLWTLLGFKEEFKLVTNEYLIRKKINKKHWKK